MKVGTKSLLFGVHLWFWHPFMVALAWWKLYGFPWDPRLWVAFMVHDWGYWGSPEMDGPVGDRHPEAGAKIMLLFDKLRLRWSLYWHTSGPANVFDNNWFRRKRDVTFWHDMALCHSRFYAKQLDLPPSPLCMADKYAIVVEPWWLYLPRAWASGELKEYMRSAQPDGKHGHMNLKQVSAKEWYRSVQEYLRGYVQEHRDGKEDRVTQVNGDRFESGKNGVWL